MISPKLLLATFAPLIFNHHPFASEGANADSCSARRNAQTQQNIGSATPPLVDNSHRSEQWVGFARLFFEFQSPLNKTHKAFLLPRKRITPEARRGGLLLGIGNC